MPSIHAEIHVGIFREWPVNILVGWFDLIVERHSDYRPYKKTNDGMGNIRIDLPYFAILYCDHRKARIAELGAKWALESLEKEERL